MDTIVCFSHIKGGPLFTLEDKEAWERELTVRNGKLLKCNGAFLFPFLWEKEYLFISKYSFSHKILEEGCGFKIGERNTYNLHYADDINVVAQDTNNLETLVIKGKYSKKNATKITVYIKEDQANDKYCNLFRTDNKDTLK